MTVRCKGILHVAVCGGLRGVKNRDLRRVLLDALGAPPSIFIGSLLRFGQKPDLRFIRGSRGHLVLGFGIKVAGVVALMQLA